ncbi:RNA-guided pseudouridylation complex pseudouridine synthase subunit Cbf5 [Methanospirillum stamsii]|uniref:RNA-guided pseudouridylation complex pseudouridine synthase subunit Cbf5 n=1 Tax=Methanospirillum stamsii TaxID=1277351 RepID=A0A2V2N1B0_9EURY|nr:RNA-guided pseudouridylation complex pseudouridine synthase subunit Cbf5 [Methanospirillum stamsii]PWR73549.1 RNA-guided pseudouridylation complex pseudouridine synthase subunit Cbf5 [Methanospirillum stamsii]
METKTSVLQDISSHQGSVILIDKPRGPSSHQVAAWVRDMTGVSSVGHTGTLDPPVSGVLVILIGRAVRLTTILHQDDKEYIALLRLQGDVSDAELKEVIALFTGRIYQKPPKRSAVKRALRIREIQDIELLSREGRLVLLRVRCDSGTYIRSLCHHIGLACGVGGHMAELRRTRSGPFLEKDCVTLHTLRDAVELARAGDDAPLRSIVRSPLEALEGIPRVYIKESAADAICHGARLSSKGIISHDNFQMEDQVAILVEKDLIAVGDALISSSRIVPGEKGLVIAPHIVMQDIGVYPKVWKTHQTKREKS